MAGEDSDMLARLEGELSLLALETELERLSLPPAPEFSIFDALCVRHENQVSTLLAYLFNINNRLPDGDNFLREFLRECFKDNSEFLQIIERQTAWKVRLEVDISGDKGAKSRRPDIVLESPEIVVFIENKIYPQAIRAGQVKDTCRYIKAKPYWKEKPKAYVLIKPKCTETAVMDGELKDARENFGHVASIEWMALSPFFRKTACRSSRMRLVLDDLASFAEQIGGGQDG